MKRLFLIFLSVCIISGCDNFNKKKNKAIGKWKPVSGNDFFRIRYLQFSEGNKCYIFNEDFGNEVHDYELVEDNVLITFKNKELGELVMKFKFINDDNIEWMSQFGSFKLKKFENTSEVEKEAKDDKEDIKEIFKGLNNEEEVQNNKEIEKQNNSQ